jgi:hypothetical protein
LLKRRTPKPEGAPGPLGMLGTGTENDGDEAAMPGFSDGEWGKLIMWMGTGVDDAVVAVVGGVVVGGAMWGRDVTIDAEEEPGSDVELYPRSL